MQYNFLRQRRYALYVISCCLTMLFVAACSAQPTAQSGQEAMQITLLAAEDDALTVQLADAAGEPITDATVSLEGNMNHAGMVPVFADGVTDEADGAADGVYQVPFQFTMMGDWIITVKVARADGSQTTDDVEQTVSDGNIQVKG
jgi:hypothetical protein